MRVRRVYLISFTTPFDFCVSKDLYIYLWLLLVWDLVVQQIIIIIIIITNVINFKQL